MLSRADPNARNDNGWTPLHQASDYGDAELLGALLSPGADINARDNKGITPLHLAHFRGHKEVVAALLTEGADSQATDDDGWTTRDIEGDRIAAGV